MYVVSPKNSKNLALMLHKVEDANWLDNIFVYLKKKYIVVPERAYIENTTSKDKPFCIITADDGNKSFFNVVFPLLKTHQLPATLFISPKVIKNNENYWFQDAQMMDKIKLATLIREKTGLQLKKHVWRNPKEVLKIFQIDTINDILSDYKKRYKINYPPQNITVDNICEMQKSGLVTFGAHTQNHPILANESKQRVELEIQESISQLSDLTGEQVTSFAYPNGNPKYDFGEREKHILKMTQVKIAYSTRIDHIMDNKDPYDVPRIGLTYGNMNFVKAKLMLGRKWTFFKPLKAKGFDRDYTSNDFSCLP